MPVWAALNLDLRWRWGSVAGTAAYLAAAPFSFSAVWSAHAQGMANGRHRDELAADFSEFT